ncbi:hypothetical protein TK90_2612 (plasmid) [Thioalkalivibrio sp. K90mix]|uniref:hypothetical protein n=1 Tax=Thioalkalivibrio sp. (strain K90mix) TaxID=396595 RepID=UPI000195AB1E|nr:hypothetical protein [Thioalkalivibrio sp. K90mix]ADC73099.1 hypothetical protein TK90_2612 [Thioalkalivibrio sp. K90mix]
MSERNIKLPVDGIEITLSENEHGTSGTVTHDPDLPDIVGSLVLAHACAGIDVEDPAYLEGLETALGMYWSHVDPDAPGAFLIAGHKEDGEQLYWSNDQGWVSEDQADVFHDASIRDPMGATGRIQTQPR